MKIARLIIHNKLSNSKVKILRSALILYKALLKSLGFISQIKYLSKLSKLHYAGLDFWSLLVYAFNSTRELSTKY